MKIFKFETTLKRPDGVGTWHYVDTPINTENEFNSKGKVPIKGKINDIKFSATLIPRGNGEHYIVLAKKIRDEVGIAVGDSMQVEIWRDLNERKVAVPEDLNAALKTEKEVNTYFKNLAYSHQKAYVEWINEAKKETTRQNRIVKAIEMLSEKKKLK